MKPAKTGRTCSQGPLRNSFMFESWSGVPLPHHIHIGSPLGFPPELLWSLLQHLQVDFTGIPRTTLLLVQSVLKVRDDHPSLRDLMTWEWYRTPPPRLTLALSASQSEFFPHLRLLHSGERTASAFSSQWNYSSPEWRPDGSSVY